MRMKRAMYKMDNNKHKNLMKKLISDDMTFNEFINRVIYMYLNEEFTLNKSEEKEE